MTKVNFFTPISFGNQQTSAWQSLLQSADSYFYLGGKKACVIDIQDPQHKTVLLQKSPALIATCLKVVSYFTLVIPLIVLLAKLLTRCTTTYILDHELQARLPASPKLCDFYEKQGILKDDGKMISSNAIKELGLELAETITVDPTHFKSAVHPLLPKTPLTLEEAIGEVIIQINTIISKNKQHNPSAPLAEIRQIRLSTQAPWVEECGSNLYFYAHPLYSAEKSPFPREESFWLHKIVTALAAHQHIFQIQATNGHGYFLQA